jgi:hypothetical protein
VTDWEVIGFMIWIRFADVCGIVREVACESKSSGTIPGSAAIDFRNKFVGCSFVICEGSVG